MAFCDRENRLGRFSYFGKMGDAARFANIIKSRAATTAAPGGPRVANIA
jgi:hypothetical protein